MLNLDLNIVLEEEDVEPFTGLCSTKSTLNDTALQFVKTDMKKDMIRLLGMISPAIEEGKDQLKLLMHPKTKEIENHTSQHLHDRQLELKFTVGEVGDRWIQMLFNSNFSIQVKMKLSLNPSAKEPSMEALSPKNHQG